jgi:hypothetical protein
MTAQTIGYALDCHWYLGSLITPFGLLQAAQWAAILSLVSGYARFSKVHGFAANYAPHYDLTPL